MPELGYAQVDRWIFHEEVSGSFAEFAPSSLSIAGAMIRGNALSLALGEGGKSGNHVSVSLTSGALHESVARRGCARSARVLSP